MQPFTDASKWRWKGTQKEPEKLPKNAKMGRQGPQIGEVAKMWKSEIFGVPSPPYKTAPWEPLLLHVDPFFRHLFFWKRIPAGKGSILEPPRPPQDRWKDDKNEGREKTWKNNKNVAIFARHSPRSVIFRYDFFTESAGHSNAENSRLLPEIGVFWNLRKCLKTLTTFA